MFGLAGSAGRATATVANRATRASGQGPGEKWGMGGLFLLVPTLCVGTDVLDAPRPLWLAGGKGSLLGREAAMRSVAPVRSHAERGTEKARGSRQRLLDHLAGVVGQPLGPAVVAVGEPE